MAIVRPLAARAGALLLTLWLVSALVFLAGQVLPGDVGRVMLGPFADAQAVAELNRKLGTDQPIPSQYWHWFSKAITGDFGDSLSMRAPVAPFVLSSIKNSAALAGVVLLFLVPIGIGAGVVAGLRSGSLADRLIVLTGVSLSIVPDFVSGLLLLMVFGLWLAWFPITGAAPDGAGFWTSSYHLILPALPLVLNLIGYVARMTRAGVIEARGADYTRTAILKGLSPSQVLFKHVLRNALVPIVTMTGLQFGYLLGGAVVVEQIFSLPGVGRQVLLGIQQKEYAVVQSTVLVIATAFVIVNLATDGLYRVIDPRVGAA